MLSILLYRIIIGLLPIYKYILYILSTNYSITYFYITLCCC
jgi:hypothetical protein